MRVIYAGEAFPNDVFQSIFLAGPTGLGKGIISWRKRALRILRRLKFAGVVFVPEPRDGETWPDYESQVVWENEGLNRSDCILFWVPRSLRDLKLPGMTTNVEFGEWFKSGKIVFGAPDDAEKVRYLQFKAKEWQVPQAETLEETIKLAIRKVTPGAKRTGGECQVPLHIWRTPAFQNWYHLLTGAGNRIDGARLEWTWRLGEKKDKVFFWILHVDTYIQAEDRNKTNEVVIGRPDIAAVVMFCPNSDMWKTEVLLVKEYRSPVANEKGYVYELPSGSTITLDMDPRLLAVLELKEETGIEIDPAILKAHGYRQMNATMTAYRAYLYSIKLTVGRMRDLRELAGQGKVMGNEEDTERIVLEVCPLHEIMSKQLVDWSTIGMIMTVIQEEVE